MTAPDMFAYGETVDRWDMYKRVRTLGRGHFGKAMLCEHRATGEQIVIKRIDISPRGNCNPKHMLRIVKEVEVMKALQHRHVVALHDVWQTRNAVYLAMEFCDYEDLLRLKLRRQAEGGTFQEPLLQKIMRQMAQALVHLHSKGIIHRDVKAANVFLTKRKGSLQVKLGDFGLSTILQHRADLAASFVGTPYYMSPEVIQGKKYSNESDVWSLGVTLYELMYFRYPFRGENMFSLRRKVMEAVVVHPRVVTAAGDVVTYSPFFKVLVDRCFLPPYPRVSAREIVTLLCDQVLLRRAAAETPQRAASAPQPPHDTTPPASRAASEPSAYHRYTPPTPPTPAVAYTARTEPSPLQIHTARAASPPAPVPSVDDGAPHATARELFPEAQGESAAGSRHERSMPVLVPLDDTPADTAAAPPTLPPGCAPPRRAHSCGGPPRTPTAPVKVRGHSCPAVRAGWEAAPAGGPAHRPAAQRTKIRGWRGAPSGRPAAAGEQRKGLLKRRACSEGALGRGRPRAMPQASETDDHEGARWRQRLRSSRRANSAGAVWRRRSDAASPADSSPLDTCAQVHPGHGRHPRSTGAARWPASAQTATPLPGSRKLRRIERGHLKRAMPDDAAQSSNSTRTRK